VRCPGFDRRYPSRFRPALTATSGGHHGQAIRIDSSEVDDYLILGPPPASVKAPRLLPVYAYGSYSADHEVRVFDLLNRLRRGPDGSPTRDR
jgi:hypothetical protein